MGTGGGGEGGEGLQKPIGVEIFIYYIDSSITKGNIGS
jgi:hypothetical protein